MDHFRSLIYPYELDEDAPLVRCRFSAGTSLGRQPAVRPDMLIGTIGNVTASLRLKASHAVSDRNTALPGHQGFRNGLPPTQ